MTLRISKTLSSKLALVGSITLATACWVESAAALDFPSIGLSGSYYGGAGVGGSNIDPRVSESGFTVTDNTDSGTQLFLGRDISARISVEGYYSDLGAASLSSEDLPSGRVEYSTIGASALLYLLGGGGVDSLASRRGLNIYARLGAGRINNQGLGIQFNRNNDWNLSGGFGVEYNHRSGFGFRSEVQSFDSDARVVSFNIVKRFQVQKNGKGIPQFLDRVSEPLPRSDKDVAAAERAAVFKKDSDGDGVNDRDDLCETTAEGASVDNYGCDFTGVLEGVTFATASAKLTQGGSDALDQVVIQLKQNREVDVSVQAHTDNRGPAEKNMQLSRKRAETVVRYLVDVGTIDLERISAIGYGESRPRQSNHTEAGRSDNRRVEIKIAE